MKTYSVLNKFSNFIAILYILITLASCQNYSDSYVPADSPKIVGDFPLKESWRKDFDSELKSMALGTGKLITGIINNDNAVVQAFDIADGSSLWKNELQGNSIGINIVVVEKVVYVIYAPKLFALDLDTGNIIFASDIGALSIDEIVAITDKHIFIVQVSEGVYAYDRLTGKLSWQVLVGRGNVDVFLDATKNFVFIVHGEFLRAVNEQDGSLEWQEQIGIHGPVGHLDGILYYSTDKTKEGIRSRVQALNLETKSELWKIELENNVKCLATESNGIVVLANQTMTMINPSTGERTWDYYISLGIYCPSVTLDSVIYLKDGSSNQIIAIEQGNGNILGRLDFGNSGGIGYKIPKDNLISSTNPFPVLAFYFKNAVLVYK